MMYKVVAERNVLYDFSLKELYSSPTKAKYVICALPLLLTFPPSITRIQRPELVGWKEGLTKPNVQYSNFCSQNGKPDYELINPVLLHDLKKFSCQLSNKQNIYGSCYVFCYVWNRVRTNSYGSGEVFSEASGFF